MVLGSVFNDFISQADLFQVFAGCFYVVALFDNILFQFHFKVILFCLVSKIFIVSFTYEIDSKQVSPSSSCKT